MFAKSAQRLGYIVITQNTHVQSVSLSNFDRIFGEPKKIPSLLILLNFDVYVLGSGFVIIVGTVN